MTVSELLDQVAFDAGDDGGTYKTAARRWLNLTRSYIAARGSWRDAIDAGQTFDTDSGTTDGFYSLTGYEHLVGDWLYDQTNDRPVTQESLEILNGVDPSKQVTGPPDYWADAGVDSSDVRQIYLWPIPDGTYTIRFDGYRTLVDLTSGNDSDTTDQFFGDIAPWSACFVAGMRYYHDMNNNEDVNQIALSLQMFERQIKIQKGKNRIARTGALELAPVRSRSLSVVAGRLDPAHFNNRQ